jgi:hypothetical protein
MAQIPNGPIDLFLGSKNRLDLTKALAGMFQRLASMFRKQETLLVGPKSMVKG